MKGDGQFALSIRKFIGKVRTNADIATRRILTQIAIGVVERSPVDTGHFRANWRYAVGAPDLTVTDDCDPTGDATLSRMLGQIETAKCTDLHFITNSLPYAQVIEYGLYPNPPKHGSWVKGQGYVIKSVDGFSQQAPVGVVRVTMLEMQQYIDKALEAIP